MTVARIAQLVCRTNGGSRPTQCAAAIQYHRDAQFHYLNQQAETFLEQGLPVVSLDAKKKELVGEFKNPGQEWQPKQQPVAVNVHDFPDPKLGKAIPYGIYDIGQNAGWVCVGQDHDTASFAVATLQRWWDMVGSVVYPNTKQLLISADSGGSNGYRVRLWKWELQRERRCNWARGNSLPPTSRDEQVEQN